MRPILAIASTTIGEAIRRKVLLVILLIGLLLVSIAPGLQVLTVRQERTVLLGLTIGVIQLTSAAIAIILTVYMIPNEIERRTIYTILCKPVKRWQFLLGKYFGAVGALGIMMALMSIVMVVVFLITRKATSADDIAQLVRVPAMFFVQMSLLSAVAICFSTFVTPLVNFFLSGGMYLVGSLFSSIFKTFEENTGTPQFVKVISMIIGSILPDFGRFAVQNPLVNNTQVIGSEQVYYFQAAVYGIAYIAVALIIGMIIFEKREV